MTTAQIFAFCDGLRRNICRINDKKEEEAKALVDRIAANIEKIRLDIKFSDDTWN